MEHPVWPFEPNWESSVGESLAWLTDVMTSPTGAEQRRSLRYLPQRSFNFSVAVAGAERALFDNLMMAHAALEWHLPVWHDVTITSEVSTLTFIPCAPSSAIRPGTLVFIKGATVFDFQTAEVLSVSSSGVTLSSNLTRLVSKGVILHPMTVARLVEQPALSAMSDAVEVAEVQFLVTEPSIQDVVFSEGYWLPDEYLGHKVLAVEPDRSDAMDRGQQRLYDTFDPGIGIPLRADTANRSFPTQRHKWVLDGVDDHGTFYSLLQALRGRAVPVWVPTWMYDMQISGTASIGAETIYVNRCGFADAGGPRPERQDIMIETIDARRFYCRIVDAAVSSSEQEVLALDTPLPFDISNGNVLRVCFMSLMRLDQDSIDIEHLTDMEGISEVQVTFRAAPNLRTAEPAF